MKDRRSNRGFIIVCRLLCLSGIWFSGNIPWASDIYDYAQEVWEEMGPFPSFNAFDPSLSRELPITQNGISLNGATATPTSLCDRPPLLPLDIEGQAVPYSRIGRLPAFDPFTLQPTTDIFWMFITRRYKIRTDPNHPFFEDVAIIGHNRRSGATAFFQAGLDGVEKDATKVPSPMGFRPLPNEPAADSFWRTPSYTAGIKCYQCHDNGPFVHSPYVDQVKVNDELIVPLLDHNPPGVGPEPYWFVGSQEFSTWPTPKYMSKPGNMCTTCHVIGNGANNFVNYFTGRESPRQVTEAFKQYPLSHYMPNVSLTEGVPTKEAWEAAWGASVNEVLACKANPLDASCWTPFRRIADPGRGRTWFVDRNNGCLIPNGNLDCNLGFGGPFHFVTDGVNHAQGEDNVLIRAANYNELVMPMTIYKHVTLRAWGGNVSIGIP